MFGDNCVKSAKMKKADEAFRKTAIKQNGSADSAARVYLRFGWRHFASGDPETAMKRFNQAWLLDPQNPSVYFAFGHLTRYAFTKSAPEAEKYYRLGRDRDPKRRNEAESLAILLDVLDNQHNLEAAIDVSSQLIQTFPDFEKGFGYKKRAFYYIQAQQFDRALADAEEALKRDPADANNYVARGFAFMWKDAPEKALADYNQAIKIDKNFAPAYGSRAQLYFEKLNQPESALTDVNKALQLEPKNTWFHKLKSEVLFKLNRPAEACQSLKNGIDLGDKSLQEDYQAKCGKK
jgi:tetratricopeptide (TPR) repeat protein